MRACPAMRATACAASGSAADESSRRGRGWSSRRSARDGSAAGLTGPAGSAPEPVARAVSGPTAPAGASLTPCDAAVSESAVARRDESGSSAARNRPGDEQGPSAADAGSHRNRLPTTGDCRGPAAARQAFWTRHSRPGFSACPRRRRRCYGTPARHGADTSSGSPQCGLTASAAPAAGCSRNRSGSKRLGWQRRHPPHRRCHRD